jgi:hypothetical protein
MDLSSSGGGGGEEDDTWMYPRLLACGTTVGRKKGREGFFVGDLRLDEAHKEWNESRRFGLCDDLP